MIELKTVKATETKVNKLLSDKETEIADINKQIKDAEAAMETSKVAMDTATNKSDLASYKKAKAENEDARIVKEMYSKRLDDLANEPLIAEKEYKSLINGIFQEMQKASDDADKQLLKLYELAHEISEQLITAGEEADKVIAKLQSDVYKDKDRARGKNGWFIDSQMKLDNYYETYHFGNVGAKSFRYNKLKEQE